MDYDTQGHMQQCNQQPKRPFYIDESLYSFDASPTLLQKLDDCRHPDLNSIDNNTLANLFKTSSQPMLVIDCRFDYEFEGGHIKNAINLNTPEALEEYFF